MKKNSNFQIMWIVLLCLFTVGLHLLIKFWSRTSVPKNNEVTIGKCEVAVQQEKSPLTAKAEVKDLASNNEARRLFPPGAQIRAVLPSELLEFALIDEKVKFILSREKNSFSLDYVQGAKLDAGQARTLLEHITDWLTSVKIVQEVPFDHETYLKFFPQEASPRPYLSIRTRNSEFPTLMLIGEKTAEGAYYICTSDYRIFLLHSKVLDEIKNPRLLAKE